MKEGDHDNLITLNEGDEVIQALLLRHAFGSLNIRKV